MCVSNYLILTYDDVAHDVVVKKGVIEFRLNFSMLYVLGVGPLRGTLCSKFIVIKGLYNMSEWTIFWPIC